MTPIVTSWVERFADSASGVTYLLAFSSHAGRGLLPDPALGWLQRVADVRGADAQFWRAHDNGSKTAALLDLMLDQSAEPT